MITLKKKALVSGKEGILFARGDILMTEKQLAKRIAAVKTADAINAMGGVPVSDYARQLYCPKQI